MHRPKLLPPSLEKVKKLIDQKSESKIKDIAIQNWKLESEEVELLATALSDFHVQTLCLNKNSFTLESLERIVINFSLSTTLQKIMLIRCNLGPEGCTRFAKSLAQNNSITLVDITGNKIKDEGAIAIANLIESKTSRNIAIYNLNDNDITLEGYKQLALSLRRNVFITQLSLSYNKSIMLDTEASRLSSNSELLETKELLSGLIARNNTAHLMYLSFSLFMHCNSSSRKDLEISLNIDVLSVIYSHLLTFI